MNSFKFIYIIILFFSFSGTVYSQSSEIAQLKVLFTKSSSNHSSKIYYNEDLKILDINGYLFDIENIELDYESNSKTVNGIKRVGFLILRCKNNGKLLNNCISYEDKNSSEVGFAFTNKEDAYKALNLITKLK
jgi:hypothetical protein